MAKGASWSSAYIQELNKNHSGGIYVQAVEVTETTSPLVVRRFSNHYEAITFNGNVYSPLPMQWSDFKSSGSMNLPSMTISMSDASDTIIAWVEEFSVLENDCNLQILHLDFLGDTTAQDSLLLKVLAIDWEEKTRTIQFTVGSVLGLGDIVPRDVTRKEEFPGMINTNVPILA